MPRTRNGIWVDVHTVTDPAATSQSAITPRPSSGAACVRPKWKRLRKTCAAFANAPSTSPASNSMCAKLLSPSSSCRTGAPGASAASGSSTAGNRSYSTSISSAASSAMSRELATTAATASPT